MNLPISRIHILLFLLLWISFAYFHHTGQHNENARYDQIRSLAENGEWNIDQYRFNTADVITVDGKVFPNKAPGTTFLGIIPWKLFRVLLSYSSLTEASQLHLVSYLVTISTLAVFSALLGCTFFSFLLGVGFGNARALLFSLLYSLGTISFPFSTCYFSHQLAASFLFLGFYFIWRQRRREKSASNSHFRLPEMLGIATAGFLLGFAPVLEYPAALGTVLIGLYAVTVLKSPPKLLIFVFAGAVGGSFLLFYNWAAFHRFLYVSYAAYAQGAEGANAFFPGQRTGLYGVGLPQWNSFLQIMIGKQRGLFYVNPWLILVFPALLTLGWVGELRKELVLCFALVTAFFLFNSGFGEGLMYWGGGLSVGPRYIIPMLPFMVIPIAILCQKVTFRVPTVILGVLSVLVMLLASAVTPRVPYESHDPIVDFFLRNYFLGRFTINESGILNPGPDSSSSFNWGKMIGLPPRAELLPLTMFWAIMIPALFRRVGNQSKNGDTSLKRHVPRVGMVFFSFAIIGVGLAPFFYNPYHVHRKGFSPGLLGFYARGARPVTTQPAPPETPPVQQLAFRRRDKEIDFFWAGGEEPLLTPFSVMWIGDLYVPSGRDYTFATESDDESALYIDNKLVINNLNLHSAQRKTTLVHLEKGFHTVCIYYDNLLFSGMMRFYWAPPGCPLEIVPHDFLFSR